MSQSLVKNYVHIVFSTKYRRPLIREPFEADLYSYLGGICRQHDCPPLRVGGHLNHVHILCGLSKRIALMKLLEKVKANSSKWMKTLDTSLSRFYWQDGYGAFSVNPAQVDRVIRYIANQHEHHRKTCFQKEYLALLEKYDMPYDERYVWD